MSLSKEKITELERSIHEAVTVHRFVDWRHGHKYEDGIEALFPFFEEIIENGQGDTSRHLIELTMRLMEHNWPKVDDSSGGLSSVFKKLQDMHLHVCEKSTPDPKELAQHLFTWAMKSDYDAFHDAPSRYAKVLGGVGMAELSRLVAAKFSLVPSLRPDSESRGKSHEHFRIKDWALQLAQETGDLNQIIQVLNRDLSLPYSFLKIAEACREHGREDLAVKWAEDGVASFESERRDARLFTFLAFAYSKAGRHTDALKFMWNNILNSGHHYLEAYQDLKTVAEAAGAWPEWREKSLSYFKEGRYHPPESGTEPLIKILLWENELEQAVETAHEHGCSLFVWEALAKALAETKPGEAYQTYETLTGFLLADYNRYGNRAWVVNTIKEMSLLSGRIGNGVVFRMWLAGIVEQNKRRTGLLNDLKRLKLLP